MMQNEQQNVRKAVFLVMAIFVAVVIWFYVDEFGNNGSPRLTKKTFDDIPIEYIHEDTLMDHGLMLVEEGSDQTVTLRLEATRRMISEIDRDKLRVTVDLADITTDGSQTLVPRISYSGYRINGQRISINQGMVKEMEPFMATVNIKELNSKPVEVRCELRGNVAEGYSAGQLQLSDTNIEIWGQAQDIDPVSYAKVTLDIGEDAESSVEEALPITFYDENDQPLDGEGIRSTVQEIKVTMPVAVSKELKLEVKLKEAPGVRRENVAVTVSPETITVSGDASQLIDRESIILAEVDLLELKSHHGSGVYEYPITVPQDCANLSGVTRATVTISFTDLTSTEVTTDRFVCENVPEGKTVEILTGEMTVAMFGTGADVNKITPEHVTLVADLSDYSAASGSYTVPARVAVSGAGDIGISGNYEIRLVIREKDPDQSEQDAGQGSETQEDTTHTGEIS